MKKLKMVPSVKTEIYSTLAATDADKSHSILHSSTLHNIYVFTRCNGNMYLKIRLSGLARDGPW